MVNINTPETMSTYLSILPCLSHFLFTKIHHRLSFVYLNRYIYLSLPSNVLSVLSLLSSSYHLVVVSSSSSSSFHNWCPFLQHLICFGEYYALFSVDGFSKHQQVSRWQQRQQQQKQQQISGTPATQTNNLISYQWHKWKRFAFCASMAKQVASFILSEWILNGGDKHRHYYQKIKKKKNKEGMKWKN